MTTTGNDLVARARSLAICVHRGQSEWGGNPFVDHPARVAKLVASAGMRPEVIAAAWLHDGVEDTTLSMGEITMLCGDEVAGIVAVLTRKAGVSYTTFVALCAEHPDGSVVKLADVVDHLDPRRRVGLSDELVARAVSLSRRYNRALDVLIPAAAEGVVEGLLPQGVAGLIRQAEQWRMPT
jgi:hypothetical protein